VKPTIRRSASAVVAAACALALAATTPATAGGDREPTPATREPSAPIVKKRKVAPGLTFTRIIRRKIPLRTFVLRMDPSKAVTLDVALADDGLPSLGTVLEMAKQGGALAAVNGDFTQLSVGRPVHAYAQDGELLHAPAQAGPVFALSLDEQTAFLGSPTPIVSITDRDTGRTWRLDRWNQGDPAPGEIAGFSTLGGSLEEPPEFSCSVRLLPEGKISFDEDTTGVVRDYLVETSGCVEKSMARNGGIVLSAPPATDEAIELLSLAPGTRMRLRWSFGWTGVYDAIGGTPILVQDGKVAVGPCSSQFCRKNPRTAIGVTANGGILMVVVDGRRPNWSVGLSLRKLAKLMRGLGAVQALNLDGGGSTTMVVENEVVNKPSDGHLRNVSNAVLVLPGPDPGEG
jgi:hypothetical protein